jgi:hypothetical protein
MTRSSRRSLLCAVGAFALAGCGGGTPEPVTVSTAAVTTAPPPKPRNADTIATAVVGGRVGTLFHVARAKGHASMAKLKALGPVKSATEGLGLDLERDVERSFAAAPSVQERKQVALVIEHKLSEAAAKGALDRKVAQETAGKTAGAGLIEGLGFPAARVTIEGELRAVGLVEPSVAVVLPLDKASDLAKFRGTGGLPEPKGADHVEMAAREPSSSLAGTNIPPVPATISEGTGGIILTPDGGASVKVRAASTNEAQAEKDAAALTKSVDDASSVGIGFLRVRMLKPVPFRAEGKEVKAELVLTANELDFYLTQAASRL